MCVQFQTPLVLGQPPAVPSLRSPSSLESLPEQRHLHLYFGRSQQVHFSPFKTQKTRKGGKGGGDDCCSDPLKYADREMFSLASFMGRWHSAPLPPSHYRRDVDKLERVQLRAIKIVRWLGHMTYEERLRKLEKRKES